MSKRSHSPQETARLVLEASVYKYNQPYHVQFAKAFIAGVFLSFGGTIFLELAGGSPSLNAANPGLVKVMAAFTFPIGLILIVIHGQELVTSNMFMMMMTTMKRRTPWYSWPLNITIVFFGNLVGCLAYAAVIVRYSGILSDPPYSTYLKAFGVAKAVTPYWHQIFLRGIGCNWLVALAIWNSFSATDVLGKIVGIHLPIWLFVAVSFDHVVANMFSLPLSIMVNSSSPPFTAGYYIWKSMIPSFLGNVVGAALLAIPYTLFYLKDEPKPENGGSISSDIELGKDKNGTTMLENTSA